MRAAADTTNAGPSNLANFSIDTLAQYTQYSVSGCKRLLRACMSQLCALNRVQLQK